MEVITIETSAFHELLSKVDNLDKKFNATVIKTTSIFCYDNESLSKLLKISTRTLQKYRDEGRISYSQVKDVIIYTQDDVDEFLENNKVRAYRNKKK